MAQNRTRPNPFENVLDRDEAANLAASAMNGMVQATAKRLRAAGCTQTEMAGVMERAFDFLMDHLED